MKAKVRPSAARRPGRRSSANCISGSRLRRSIHTNTTSSSADSSRQPSVAGAAQPHSGPCTRVVTSRLPPRVTAMQPARSNERPRARGPSTGSQAPAATAHAVASGTITASTAGQPKAWVSTPPSSVPSARPAALAMLQIASARLRAGPSAYSVLISARVAGNSNAAPMPCAARARISSVASGANAPSSEARANSSMPSR